jgi:hypothetical protein
VNHLDVDAIHTLIRRLGEAQFGAAPGHNSQREKSQLLRRRKSMKPAPESGKDGAIGSTVFGPASRRMERSRWNR